MQDENLVPYKADKKTDNSPKPNTASVMPSHPSELNKYFIIIFIVLIAIISAELYILNQKKPSTKTRRQAKVTNTKTEADILGNSTVANQDLYRYWRDVNKNDTSYSYSITIHEGVLESFSLPDGKNIQYIFVIRDKQNRVRTLQYPTSLNDRLTFWRLTKTSEEPIPLSDLPPLLKIGEHMTIEERFNSKAANYEQAVERVKIYPNSPE